jgi:hypothetical protein
MKKVFFMSLNKDKATSPIEIPWWREPWCWLVLLGPCVAVVAGLTTWAIAMQGSDQLVAIDYYQQGIALSKQDKTANPMLSAGMARNHAASAANSTSK